MTNVVSIKPEQSKKIWSRTPRNFAFVTPRFGADVGGGAETLVRELAIRLANRGDNITILTTCAKDNRTWENALPEGTSVDSGMEVFRFSVDPRNLDIWVPHQISIHEGVNPGIEAQLDWLQHSVNSSKLYKYIADYSDKFDAIFFAPYLFGTTFWGSLVRPAKSVLIPCLHDENYSYLEAMRGMFQMVRGCMFNAEPEKDLAQRLYGGVRGEEVGMGFVPFSEGYVDNLEPYLDSSVNYIIYVGRKETGKNAHKLVDDFIAAKTNKLVPSDLKLVFIGGGSFSDLFRPEALKRDDIIDIGFLDERDKHRLIRHAKALCQPSRNESFSIVLMEAWLLGVPVVVDSQCPVTRHHVIESNGGLYFDSSDEFAAVVSRLVGSPALAHQLGRLGFNYVKEKYSWDAVLERFDHALQMILE